MKEPVWVLREVVLMLHEQSLAQFGGSPGIRDEGLLDSALASRRMFSPTASRASLTSRPAMVSAS